MSSATLRLRLLRSACRSIVLLWFLAACGMDSDHKSTNQTREAKVQTGPEPSPFQCPEAYGWQPVTETTNPRAQVSMCYLANFSEIPPLAERVTVSTRTLWIVVMDTASSPCTLPNWSLSITGITISVGLFQSPSPSIRKLCIDMRAPVKFRYRLIDLEPATYTVNATDTTFESLGTEVVRIRVP